MASDFVPIREMDPRVAVLENGLLPVEESELAEIADKIAGLVEAGLSGRFSKTDTDLPRTLWLVDGHAFMKTYPGSPSRSEGRDSKLSEVSMGGAKTVYFAVDIDLQSGDATNAAILKQEKGKEAKEELAIPKATKSAYHLGSNLPAVEDGDNCYSFQPYCPSVDKFLEEREITEPELQKLVENWFHGIHDLHEAGLLHRDIKLANLAVNEPSMDGLLADFGEAIKCEDSYAKMAGMNQDSLPPELTRERYINLGAGVDPFTRYEREHLHLRLQKWGLDDPEPGEVKETLQYSKNADLFRFGEVIFELLDLSGIESTSLLELAKRLTNLDPDQRPTFPEVYPFT